jgi:hypothetical protein
MFELTPAKKSQWLFRLHKGTQAKQLIVHS